VRSPSSPRASRKSLVEDLLEVLASEAAVGAERVDEPVAK
jgi:hypothetical protein